MQYNNEPISFGEYHNCNFPNWIEPEEVIPGMEFTPEDFRILYLQIETVNDRQMLAVKMYTGATYAFLSRACTRNDNF